MRILGIETSADETSVAVVEDGQHLLSNVIASSVDLTAKYGGIVPEVAARSHLEVITPVIEEALLQANASWDEIDAIAVTRGPGLLGSLLIGSLAARSLAITKNKPLYGVNHVQAHVYANFITSASPALRASYQLSASQPKFPFLALIVSGGHTQLVLMQGHLKYQILGKTSDDAAGEAFDKVAKILGLPQPGGPAIAKAALPGNHEAIKLPIAKAGELNFSFSGLKTAVLRAVQELCGQDYTFPSSKLPDLLNSQQVADVAASFQSTAVKALVDATVKASRQYESVEAVLAGGVAANQLLRQELARSLPIPLLYPDIKLCTDNAAMIAALGYHISTSVKTGVDPYALTVDPSLVM